MATSGAWARPEVLQGPRLTVGLSRLPLRSNVNRNGGRSSLRCRANQTSNTGLKNIGAAVSAAAAAALLSVGAACGPALASELDLLLEPTPTSRYVIDDAGVLSKATRQELNQRLKNLEAKTNYRLEVATVRKLEFETDPFAFGDKVIEKWYPSVEQGTNKGILLVVTSAKEGALTGGPAFLKATGDDLIDSIVGDNIPIFTEEEKFNETVLSSLKRIEATLTGQEDPGAPERQESVRRRTYKTKEETASGKGVTSTIVISLLVISVVVPMLQYYGYTAKE